MIKKTVIESQRHITFIEIIRHFSRCLNMHYYLEGIASRGGRYYG